MSEDKLVLGLLCLIFTAWFLWPIMPLGSLLIITFIVWLIYAASQINGNW